MLICDYYGKERVEEIVKLKFKIIIKNIKDGKFVYKKVCKVIKIILCLDI